MSLYWYNGEVNFGDALSPLICAHYLGRIDLSWASARKATVGGIGSVVDTMMLHRPSPFPKSVVMPVRSSFSRRLRAPLALWGCGLICHVSGSAGYSVMRKARAFAVRGEKTRAELVSMAALVNPLDEIALGDPAILSPELMPMARTRRHRLGFVPHVAMFRDGTAQAFAAERTEFFVINPGRPPWDVINDIVSCDEVFSCSLHGLILADAYGVPNHWVGWSHPRLASTDNAFKYQDYYSAFGERREPYRLSEVRGWKAADPVDALKLEQARTHLKEAATLLQRWQEDRL